MRSDDQLFSERVWDSGRLWVNLRGEIDIANSVQVYEDLCEAVKQAPETVIDLQDVTFIDSSGIHALVDIHDLAVSVGHGMTVKGAHDMVARVLQITGVDAVLYGPQ